MAIWVFIRNVLLVHYKITKKREKMRREAMQGKEIYKNTQKCAEFTLRKDFDLLVRGTDHKCLKSAYNSVVKNAIQLFYI